MTALLTLILLFSYFKLKPSSATDIITATEFLKYPQIIVSNNKTFTLGFFSPPNSTHHYVGIWYTKPSVREVIWVANRNNPLNDSSGVFRVSRDNNLQLLNAKNKIIWSSNISTSTVNGNFSAAAQIMDSGNLVLRVKDDVLWQSFDHPTDCFLPNMKLGFSKSPNGRKIIQSWKSSSDPSDGRFTAGYDGLILPQLLIWDRNHIHWRSGPWNGNYLIGVQFNFKDFINAQMVISSDREGSVYATYFYPNKSLLSTYMVNSEGKMTQIWWDEGKRSWEVEWMAPATDCDVYGKCGAFGTCYPQRRVICKCLKGFEPMKMDEWFKEDWRSGCVRKKQLQCGNGDGKNDGFLRLKGMKVPDEAEWKLGLSQDGCRNQCLKNCSCLAYAYDIGAGCMTWSTSLVDIQEFSVGGVDLYLRLARSELGSNSNAQLIIALAGSILGATVTGLVLCFLWKRRARKQASKNNMNGQKFQVKLEEHPMFEFEVLAAATKNFSQRNKLGRGGFGTVYRGILEDGQEIAVKRLSRLCGQGIDEFMNEVMVISELQHRNLVKFLGCSVTEEDKMLVYEYMPNKSLDAFIFDPAKKKILDWEKRLYIIEGICRGLEYLHRDSRLKIIHRDLKSSNILLDKELNPKISDFGMARIFGGEQDQANTRMIVGTYGYMSPEYAMEGIFSEKSDVFSFGVLLLEIISGERNTTSYDEESLSLIGYAWKLWKENKEMSLVDPIIAEPCCEADILRCFQVGLLCVQELAIERPNISAVISMLHGDISDLPRPCKPGFTHISKDSSSSPQNKQDSSSNYISLTHVHGR